jgi:hypothetical protein
MRLRRPPIPPAGARPRDPLLRRRQSMRAKAARAACPRRAAVTITRAFAAPRRFPCRLGAQRRARALKLRRRRRPRRHHVRRSRICSASTAAADALDRPAERWRRTAGKKPCESATICFEGT